MNALRAEAGSSALRYRPHARAGRTRQWRRPRSRHPGLGPAGRGQISSSRFNRTPYLSWWLERIGDLALSEVTLAVITETRAKLLKNVSGPTERWGPRRDRPFIKS